MKFTNKLLSEVVFFQEGPGVRKFQFRNEGVKLLNVGNINKGVLDTSTTKLYISEEEAYGKYKHFLVDEGDLLIASSGIVVDNFHNKIAYVKKEHLPLCLNTSTIRFKTLDENVFNLDYLKFYLKTTHFKNQLRKLITGAAQLNFGPSHLKKITLPVPPLPDQLHIANLLSKTENLIAQRKESIRLLDEFLKSTFLEMFGDPVRNEKGWKTKPLNQIVDKLGDGLHGTPVYDDNGEYFFINGNNLEKGFIRTDEKTKRVSYEEYTKHTKELNENTILVSINGTLGRVAFYRGEKIILGKSACYFNLIKGSIDSLFLFHFLQSEFFLKYVTNKATGSTISNVSLKTMRELPIIIPPPILQTQFAQIVEKTEALKTQYQQSLQELENLYGSLSQKAFRGELKMKQNV